MRPQNRGFGRWLVVLGGLLLAGCSASPPDQGMPGGGYYKLGNPYQIGGRWYYPTYDPSYAAVGVASWYGHPFHGRKTANGELYDMAALTAAHPTLPLPSIVRVTNLANRRQLELRVNDRGPFVGERLIDLSQAAARELGFERRGTTEVRVEFLRLADAPGMPREPAGPQLVRAAAPQQSRSAAQPMSEVAPRPGEVASPRPVATPVPPPVGAVAVQAAAAPVPRSAAGPAIDRHAAGDTMAKRCLSAGFIQVGAFVEPERALRLAKELDAAIALPVSADPPSVDRYARVRLGPIDDRHQAEAALRWLRQIGYPNAFLVRPDVTTSVAC